MKKLLTLLFALIMISSVSFGLGNQFTWNGSVNSDWQNTLNWTIVNLGGTATWPGQMNPAQVGDIVIFNDGNGGTLITNVPTCTLSRLEITPLGPFPTAIYLEGSVDGSTITFDGSVVYANLWNVKIDDNCELDCDNFNGWTNGNRVKIIMDPLTNFWQKSGALFEPATYAVCTADKGFLLRATSTGHAEYIQQLATAQAVKGWQELYLTNMAYHFISLPITSLWPVAGEFVNVPCRTPNCLCVFDGDYVRKYSNGATWDNWLGNLGTCFNPILNIETGRGYEFYSNVAAPNIHTLYGTFNSGTAGIPLPVTSSGWNFIGNPFASAITFGEPSGAPTAGQGWTWNHLFTAPVAYWWDNSVGNYVWYNWYTGDPSLPPPSGVDPKVLPRAQGFFVYVYTYSPPFSDITVSNDARVFRGNYSIGKSSPVNKMDLVLLDESGKRIDNVYISFRDDVTTSDFDRVLDAYKLFNDFTNVSQLYGKTTDNVNVVQKSLKLESGNVMYPVYMKVTTTGTYTIDATTINTFSQNTGIILKDNKTNTTVDLKVNPTYTFTATAGDDDARFSLYFSNVLYGINNLNNNSFKVYSYDNSIFIQNNDVKGAFGEVLVYDMIGKQMLQEKLNSDAITRINTNLNKGFYIVSIKTDKGVYNQKVYIN